MLQGVGSRFDFHVCKTLSDLRCVRIMLEVHLDSDNLYRTREIFDIIIDFPDSQPALEDLKVRRARMRSSPYLKGYP